MQAFRQFSVQTSGGLNEPFGTTPLPLLYDVRCTVCAHHTSLRHTISEIGSKFPVFFGFVPRVVWQNRATPAEGGCLLRWGATPARTLLTGQEMGYVIYCLGVITGMARASYAFGCIVLYGGWGGLRTHVPYGACGA